MSLTKLLKKKNKKILFTTPSHSQSFFIYKPLVKNYKTDISETDAYNPQKALREAELKAAKIYKTVSTKFLTNGSTSGIITAVLSCVDVGDKVLIWRDAHCCHQNAIKLAGAIPIYYDLTIDEDFGVPLPVSCEELEKYLQKYDIKALIVTSPTYEGFVSDIKSIKKLCEKYNAYLIVDEAHGALYSFSDKLPQSAVNIADFTIQSLHKTAGGLNPTALLHTMTNLDIEKAFCMINTTSPSYPILASIEENIRYLNSWKFKLKINSLIEELQDLYEECENCEFAGDDLTKILVKIDGYSGEELSEILYEDFDIEDEKTNSKSTLLLCGLGTDKNKIKKLKNALKQIN